MSPHECAVRGLTERMLTVAKIGDMAMLAPLVRRLIGSHSPQRHAFEPVLLELVGVIVRALQRRSATGNGLYAVEILGPDDRAVEIDHLQPVLRAVLRAVLATLNDDDTTARFQVSLVSADPDPLARLDAVAHALRWANGLTAEQD